MKIIMITINDNKNKKGHLERIVLFLFLRLLFNCIPLFFVLNRWRRWWLWTRDR